MKNKFQFVAEVREEKGKSAARRMRREQECVPSVVYGGDRAPQLITLVHKDILHALQEEGVYSRILELLVEGQQQQVVLKEVQRHPYKPKIMHVDFLRVKAKEKITMRVPLSFLGEEKAPGIRAGGVFTKNMTELEIRCLPNDLPECIEVDVSTMGIDQIIHLSEIRLPTGVQLTHLSAEGIDESHDHPVINLHRPKIVSEEVESGTTEETKGEAAEEKSVAKGA